MKDILASKNLAVLAEFAWSSVLVAFDYDGTLAPIVSTPARAQMRAGTRQLLSRVAQRYPCIVISGRTRADLTRRLSRVPLWSVFGKERFVGSDNVFAALEHSQHDRALRLQAADKLSDDFDFGIVDDFINLVGEHTLRQITAARFFEVVDDRLFQPQRAAGGP